MSGERFALSTDGVTYEEAPVEPKVEFAYGPEISMRGDRQRMAQGGYTLRWYFGDQFLTGEQFYWFQKWVTGLSSSIYIISKIPEVTNSDGDPEYLTMSGVMGRPTGEIYSEEGEGQTFQNVSIDFWGLT